jgi:2-amino-4-hydroxy-6-hydroxymethyldihydropteridine diphosphokinase
MSFCLIGLGANLGNRRETLEAAVARLRHHPAMRLTATSPWYETAPVGGPPRQPDFLNGALVAETSLPPQALLELLQQVERELGRRPAERWGPRPIDLDLLLYDQLVLSTPTLVLPHPRMAWRRFVLEPAAEVAGAMIHPTTGWTLSRLLEHLDTAAPYVAITGPIGAGKTELAERLARQTAARLIAEPLDLAQLEAFYADPAGRAWQTELQFLQQRSRLLAAGAPPWVDAPRLVLSDFWFHQSLAFARVWLAPEQLEEFRRQWEGARRGVVRPKLIVLLDAPGAELLRRVVRRGRRGERSLQVEQLERIRQAILAEASQGDVGPLLRLTSDDADAVFDEVLAAVQAME